MPQGPVIPANSILVNGNPTVVEVEIGANATAAKMLPGRLVIHDTTDGDVKEAGAGADNVLGVLDVAPDGLKTDAYAVGDQALILKPPCQVVLTLVSGGSAVAPGDPLVAAADGKVTKQAVGAMGAQGSVVAKAQQTKDPSAADKECVCDLLLGAEPAAAS